MSLLFYAVEAVLCALADRTTDRTTYAGRTQTTDLQGVSL